MKTNRKTENKALLQKLRENNSHSAVVDKKLLASVKTSSEATAVKKTAEKKQKDKKTETEKRDIKTYVIETLNNKDLKNTELREYMHKAVDNEHSIVFLSEDKKEHRTVFFNQKTQQYEILSKDIAKALIKEHMIENSAIRDTYRTRDFQQLLQSASSSYTDMIRNACRELEKEKFLEIREISEERTRAKYEYVLLKK